MADLLTVLHDIDRMHGKTCGACRFWSRPATWDQLRNPDVCRRGHRPLDSNDGCDDWQPRQHEAAA